MVGDSYIDLNRVIEQLWRYINGKSYKRECQETFFSARLRRRMLSCIQSPTASNAHAPRLIVLDLSHQQRDFGFRFPAVSCLWS